MSVDTRRERILELIGGPGYVAIEDLAAHFRVTPQTIRGDLNMLADQGRLIRHHGGASIPSSVRNTSYAERHGEFALEKAGIAATLAAWLPDQPCSLFLTLGTTTLAIARAIAMRAELKVITNSLEAAQVLVAQPGIEVIVLGGRLENRNQGVSGTSTLVAVEQYRTDVCIFSVGGVDRDGNLLDYHESEVAVVRAMMRCARKSVLAIDHSKFGRTASVRVAALTDVAAIVTDQALPPHLRSLLRRHPVEVLISKQGTVARR
ncbi:MAG: DeoR/GlpR family DNA-binding transcription regulator [Betaproteobacteria bacterium]